MESMSPGRAAAQAAHAQSCFDNFISAQFKMGDNGNQEELEKYFEWKGLHRFGTVIVLGATIKQIEELTHIVGYVTDPEYHLKDGLITHLIPNVITGAWAFLDKEKGDQVFSHLELYNGPIV